jgi:hypothetical protein
LNFAGTPTQSIAYKNQVFKSGLAIAESFFRDDVIDLGSSLGPNFDLTFGYTLVADGPGGFGFDFALGGAVPEPSTWAMMLVGFAGLGFAGYRSTRRCAGGLRPSVREFRPSVNYRPLPGPAASS